MYTTVSSAVLCLWDQNFYTLKHSSVKDARGTFFHLFTLNHLYRYNEDKIHYTKQIFNTFPCTPHI